MNPIDIYVEHNTNENRYGVISIFGISGLLSAVILGIGLYKKVHRSLLSEFMMYIIISEIINSFSKLLSLNRYDITIPFENFIFIWDKIIQLYIGIFVDTCTIFSTLIISMKIYDGTVQGSKIFKRKEYQIGARIAIFVFPLIISIILGTIHMLTYPHMKKDPDYRTIEKLCDLISCRVDDNILMGQYGINITIILCTLIVNILTLLFLRKKKREFSIRAKEVSSALLNTTVNNIDASRFKLYLFPFINIVIWLAFMITNIIYHHTGNLGLKRCMFSETYLWFYSAFHGLRGILYSLLFIFTRKELINYIFCLHLCKKNLNETEEKRIENDVGQTELGNNAGMFNQ